jgi:hypothetical protein
MQTSVTTEGPRPDGVGESTASSLFSLSLSPQEMFRLARWNGSCSELPQHLPWRPPDARARAPKAEQRDTLGPGLMEARQERH